MPKSSSILIADDDRVTVQMIGATLRKGGYGILQAYDAMQAFMFAQREQPAAVLVDVNMPGGSGLDVVKKLKNSLRMGAAPVIAMSVSQDPTLPERAEQAGADAFLRKPVDNDALLQLLERLLGS